jgi:AcrR family transcriptional regulator
MDVMSYTGRTVKQNDYDAPVTRRYEQRLRAEAAKETRRRILEALYETLREAPSERVTVDVIARRARVARSTVYLIFGSRAGLFDALTADLLWRGAGYARILDAVRHPNAREHLRGGLQGGVQMYAAHRDVFRVLYSMAQLDPAGIGQGVARSEGARADGMAYVARRLADQRLLREDVTTAEAANVIWLLASFDAFDLLYTGRELSAEQTAEILVATAERALLA